MNKCLILSFLLLHAYLFTKAQTKDVSQNWTCLLRIETQASFPGGENKWKAYLKDNFRENSVRCQMHLQDTTFTQIAEIWFVIDRDGSIIDAGCVNKDDIGLAFKNEAIRLIMEAPKWTPGQQNGRFVKTFKKEKISITVSPVSL